MAHVSPGDLIIRGNVPTADGFAPRTVVVHNGRIAGVDVSYDARELVRDHVVLADDEVLIPDWWTPTYTSTATGVDVIPDDVLQQLRQRFWDALPEEHRHYLGDMP